MSDRSVAPRERVPTANVRTEFIRVAVLVCCATMEFGRRGNGIVNQLHHAPKGRPALKLLVPRLAPRQQACSYTYQSPLFAGKRTTLHDFRPRGPCTSRCRPRKVSSPVKKHRRPQRNVSVYGHSYTFVRITRFAQGGRAALISVHSRR